jgi:Type II secretion system (T2SS), protein G
MLDQFVDSFVTPQGLVDLLGKDPEHNGGVLTINRTGFTDFDEYTIEAGKPATDPAKTVRAVLRRQGITWRVVRVGFPPGDAPWETAEPPGGAVKIAHQSIERLAGVLDIYKLDVGTYPTTDQGLPALITRPSGLTRWNGPYLKSEKCRRTRGADHSSTATRANAPGTNTMLCRSARPASREARAKPRPSSTGQLNRPWVAYKSRGSPRRAVPGA